MAATKIVLNLVVVPCKIESENPLLRYEDQPPRQTGSAFVYVFPEFTAGNARVRVRI